jgi:hypothetical protein
MGLKSILLFVKAKDETKDNTEKKHGMQMD